MAKKEKKQVPLEASLWAACNKLRGSVAATDYVNVVLGLLFLRFAYTDVAILLNKNGFPPQPIDEAYDEIMKQVDNYKKNHDSG